MTKPGSGRVLNPEMLIVARQSRSFSQVELADAAGVTQGWVSKLENGLAEPNAEQAQALAKALGYPVDLLYRRDHIIGLPASFTRKRVSKVPKKVFERLHAILNLRRINLAVLLRSVQVDSRKDLPQFDVDEFGSPEKVARMVRAAWGLPPGPIRNLIAVLEDAGILLVPCDFGIKDLDAIAQYVPGLPPLIYYDTHAMTDRLRFTLGHELGHLVMHQFPSAEMEDEADRFASEFLMPERDIAPHLAAGVSMQSLAALKQVWRVSMAALLRRARDLKKIPAHRYKSLTIELVRAGYKLREPPETMIEPEEPTVFRDLLRVHFKELGYSVEELSKVLDLYPSEFREVFGQDHPHLRLMAM